MSQLAKEFKMGGWVRFTEAVDPHPVVEQIDPPPYVPEGTRGQVVQVDEGSILVQLYLEGGERPLIRLFEGADQDCTIEAVEQMMQKTYSFFPSCGCPPSPDGYPSPHSHFKGEPIPTPFSPSRVDVFWPDEPF